ncbi:MAG: alpha/beta fold hydrolase [Candidatus Hodarchaeales archaeon]|jgi:pimeloyl-ACP methyl ester carboxylesterase
MTDSQTGFAEVNNVKIYYELIGSGTPLVFIHAGVADSQMWEDQVKFYSSKFQVLTYDMRGFGKTKPREGSFNHSHDLYELLNYLNIQKTHLVGCSKGGGTAMDFTLEHPDMVYSLTMVSSGPNGYKYPFESDKIPGWDECVTAFNNGDLEKTAELEAQMWVVGRYRKRNEVDQKIFDMIKDADLIALKNEVTVKMEEKLIDPPAPEHLKDIKNPTLFVYGELDDPNLVKANKLLINEMRAKCYEIKGVAHFPNIEKPNEFNSLLHEFLRKNS